jgi:hypothetical protein
MDGPPAHYKKMVQWHDSMMTRQAKLVTFVISLMTDITNRGGQAVYIRSACRLVVRDAIPLIDRARAMADFAAILAAKKLAEHPGCSISHETLRGG